MAGHGALRLLWTRARPRRAEMTVWIGTSGWQYRDWRGLFYPERLPQRLWLQHYATGFDCVEVNNTFYRLPGESVFHAWRAAVPPRFRFALKLSRYVSHIRRLRDVGEPLRTFLERAAGLERRTGPLLLQLPPTLTADAERLSQALDAVPALLRVAVEVRHESWFDDGVARVLRRHRAALCLTDRDGQLQEPEWATARWGYLRFHRGSQSGWRYSDEQLRGWAARVREIWGPAGQVFAFFNNDPGGAAVRDAVAFAGACADAGLRVSRVPPPPPG
jgi:uncharacterized protein YecE (DUF72 family)